MINNQNLAVLSEKVAYLESAVKNSDEASEISYDNTESGLTADDVQAAIDEIAPALTAEGTSYDNTDSGLIADDTQGAIDEVNAKFGDIIIENVASLFTYDTTYNIWATASGALTKEGYTLVGIIVNATSTNSPAACGISFQGGYGRIRGWDSTYTFIASAIWIKNS